MKRLLQGLEDLYWNAGTLSAPVRYQSKATNVYAITDMCIYMRGPDP